MCGIHFMPGNTASAIIMLSLFLLVMCLLFMNGSMTNRWGQGNNILSSIISQHISNIYLYTYLTDKNIKNSNQYILRIFIEYIG